MSVDRRVRHRPPRPAGQARLWRAYGPPQGGPYKAARSVAARSAAVSFARSAAVSSPRSIAVPCRGAPWRARAARSAARVLLVSFAAFAVTGSHANAQPTDPTPRFADVRASHCPSDVRLLDRHGAVLHELRLDPTRRRLAWTALADVSPALTTALLVSEDRRFVAHAGVDWQAIAAALWQRLRGGARRGASTLTMQLAALLEPDLHARGGPRTLAEKWRQMRAAWRLERTWSKEKILEAYLNLVTFRGEMQGVAAAAHVLFGKDPHGLTHAESLVLAALVRAPNAEREALLRRAMQLDSRLSGAPAARLRAAHGRPLQALGSPGSGVGARLDAAQDSIAIAVDRVVATSRGAARVALAPHAARRLMPQRNPAPCTDTPSTLDAALQRYAAEVLRRHLLTIRDRSARDGAVLVADNATGEVLAYVAASGDLSSARHVDGIQARRQAGSTLKPFLYALAIGRRLLTPASLLDDSPLEIAAGSGALFRPRNYDERFRGMVSLRTALAGSLNVPAVRALLLVGPDTFAAQLRELGFTGVVEAGDHYGPALALGAADVTLWQLTNAYRALANGGTWTPLRMQAGLERASGSPPVAVSGDNLEGAAPSAPSFRATAPTARRPPGTITDAAAFIVSDILADRDGRSLTFGLESPLATRFWSAVKTGTSKDMRDNWCIGFSRRYTVGVWVGNFSGAPMRDVSGVAGAAPIWHDVISWLHRELPSDPPAPPPGIALATTAFAAGTEPARREWFLVGTEPALAHSVRANAPRIVAPAEGSIIAVDPDIGAVRQRVAFIAADADRRLRWVLDGADLGSAAELLLWPPRAGQHTLQLVAPEPPHPGGDGAPPSTGRSNGGRTLGTVRFEVRGGAVEPGPRT